MQQQPRERLFLGRQIPQTERGANNDIVTSQKKRYRLNLHFQKSPEGVEQALENLGVIETKVKGEVFVIWLGLETERGTRLVRILTRKELETLFSPKKTKKTNMRPVRS